MIPQEIRRDYAGNNRIERIHQADELVSQARLLADGMYGTRRFSELGAESYYGWLCTAAERYRDAGLGTMADRINAVMFADPDVAWMQFDRQNKSEEL